MAPRSKSSVSQAASKAPSSSIDSQIIKLIESCGDEGIFAHQILEELHVKVSATSPLLDLRIATVTGEPHYVWSFPENVFNALITLGSSGALTFTSVSPMDAKLSLLGVKTPHPLLKAGASSSTVMHMIPLRVVKGINSSGGYFAFESGGTSFNWRKADKSAEKPIVKSVSKAKKGTGKVKKVNGGGETQKKKGPKAAKKRGTK